MTMKKILFWAAVTILAAVSCNKLEIDTPTPEGDAFVATIEGSDTKTVIDGMMSYWKGTEGIRVFDGKLPKGKVFSANLSEKSQTAIFASADNNTLNGDDYLAVYPEGPAGSVTWGGNVANKATKFWLPGEQNEVDGSYDPSTHIAVAYTSAGNNTLAFKTVNALVKVVIPYDNITEVCFYGNNKEKITGNFDLLYNNGEPVVSGATLDYAKLVGTLTKGSTYYISILPQTFNNGFTVEFVMNGTKYIKKVNSEYKVSRNQIIELPTVEYSEFKAEKGKVYLKPSADWMSSDARFAACFMQQTGPKTNKQTWVDMKRVPNMVEYYECEVLKDATGVIFCRMNPNSTTNGWTQDTQKWNQTSDLIMHDGSVCEITGWDNSSKWSGTQSVDDYLFLKPNSNWTQSTPRFAAYFYNSGSDSKWVDMTDYNKDGIYEVRKPSAKAYKYVIFCRMNPSSTTNGWTQDTQKWNQTGDLTIPTNGNNFYTVKDGTWDKGGGTWSKK